MSSWVGETPRDLNQHVDEEVAFFLIVTLATFILFVGILIVHARGFSRPLMVRNFRGVEVGSANKCDGVFNSNKIPY